MKRQRRLYEIILAAILFVVLSMLSPEGFLQLQLPHALENIADFDAGGLISLLIYKLLVE